MAQGVHTFLDLANDTPFTAEEWIGVGRKYTLNVPEAVADAKNDRLRIPEAFRSSYIPSPDLLINDFLQLNLPRLSNQFISTKPHIWFNPEKPNTNPLCLMSRPIPTEVVVGLVITMYSKSAAKNAKNESADVTGNVSALSRVVVQIFEHTYARQFRAIPSATALLQTHQYAILPPSNLLTLLNVKPVSTNYSGFELSQTDMALFADLKEGSSQLNQAMKTFRKRDRSA